MAVYAFKGSGTICGVTYTKKLRKVDEDDGESEIDVTGAGDTTKYYEDGQGDWKLTFEALGSCPAKGTKGSVSVTWGDGTTTTKAKAVVVGRKKSGSMGQAVVYTGTLREYDDT